MSSAINDLIQFFNIATDARLTPAVARILQVILILIVIVVAVAVGIYTFIIIMILLKSNSKKVQPNIGKNTFNGWYLNNIPWFMETLVSLSGVLGLLVLAGIIYRYKLLSVTEVPILVWIVIIYLIMKFSMDTYRLSAMWGVYEEYSRATKMVRENLTLDQDLFKKLTREDGSIRSGISGEVEDHKGNNQNTDTTNNINIDITGSFLIYLNNSKVDKEIVKKIRDGRTVDPVQLITPSTFNILEKDPDTSYSKEFNDRYDKIGNNVQKIIIQTQSTDISSIYLIEFAIMSVILYFFIM